MDEHLRIFTNLAAVGLRTVEDASASVALGDGVFTFDSLDLGDLDGDGRSETFVPVEWDPTLSTAYAGIVFGADLGFGATVDLRSVALTAVSTRSDAGYGYRVALSPDVDGDGNSDILLGGPADHEGGTDAGGVLTVPVPN